MKYKRRTADKSPEVWGVTRNRNSVMNSRRYSRSKEESASRWGNTSSRHSGSRPSRGRIIEESSTPRQQVRDHYTATDSRGSTRICKLDEPASSWEGTRDVPKTTDYQCSNLDYTTKDSTRCWEEITNRITDFMQNNHTNNEQEHGWRDLNNPPTQESDIGLNFEDSLTRQETRLSSSCRNCGVSHPPDYVCQVNYYEENRHANASHASREQYEERYRNGDKTPKPLIHNVKEEHCKKKIKKCKRRCNRQLQLVTPPLQDRHMPLGRRTENTENTRASLLIAIETLKDVLVSMYDGQDPVQAVRNGLNNLVSRYDPVDQP